MMFLSKRVQRIEWTIFCFLARIPGIRQILIAIERVRWRRVVGKPPKGK